MHGVELTICLIWAMSLWCFGLWKSQTSLDSTFCICLHRLAWIAADWADGRPPRDLGSWAKAYYCPKGYNKNHDEFGTPVTLTICARKCLGWPDLPWMIITVIKCNNNAQLQKAQQMGSCGSIDLITNPEVGKVKVTWNKCKEIWLQDYRGQQNDCNVSVEALTLLKWVVVMGMSTRERERECVCQ